MTEKKAKREVSTVRANGIRREFCDFAQEHGFIINPKGWDYYIENINMFSYCPCDKTRKHCPCPEAVTEVPEKGHCLCRLFWRDFDTFKEMSLL